MRKLDIVSAEKSVEYIQDQHAVMVGGFGLIGAPLTLIEALADREVSQLTILSNNIGEKGKGLGKLLEQGKIRKAIGSYFTSNRDVVKFYNEGKLEVELLPQGTFVEAIRAAGAGLGGFFTKTGVGTKIAENKWVHTIDGVEYLFQEPLKANVALIKAWKADKAGNVVYYKTARNFNAAMATAADFVIVEADEIVEIGELEPDQIVTPQIYVDLLVQSTRSIYDEGV